MKVRISYHDPETKRTKQTTVDHDGGATLEAAGAIIKRDLSAALGWTDIEVLGEGEEAPAEMVVEKTTATGPSDSAMRTPEEAPDLAGTKGRRAATGWSKS